MWAFRRPLSPPSIREGLALPEGLPNKPECHAEVHVDKHHEHDGADHKDDIAQGDGDEVK